MKTKTGAILAIAAAIISSTACLQAQTQIGERYVSAGAVVGHLDDLGLGAGFGASAEINVPVSPIVDLHATVSSVRWEDNGLTLYDSTLMAGVVVQNRARYGTLFTALNLGYERLDAEYYGYGEDIDSLLGNVLVGVELHASDRISVTPYVGYTYWEETEGDAFLFGARASVRVSRKIHLIANVQIDEDSTSLIGVSALIKF